MEGDDNVYAMIEY